MIDVVRRHLTISQYEERIFSIFQIGRNTYNLTFHLDIDIENTKRIKGRLYIEEPRLPTVPTVKINIRAVPEQEVRQKLTKYNCGTITDVQLIYHRGTNLHNGYRQVSIENYQPGKIPPFVYLGRAPCKVYLLSRGRAQTRGRARTTKVLQVPPSRAQQQRLPERDGMYFLPRIWT